MECPSCQGKMQWKTAPFSIDRNGYHITWDAIPAWVCEDCGEVVFETKEVDLIQTALNQLDQETASLLTKEQALGYETR